jgi:aspartyl-tRNA(Asn)/glutamyl-tRNA(Gln) amidotransferase subunit B
MPPVAVPDELLQSALASVPELPLERAERFRTELGLHEESARLLAFRRALGDYFEETLRAAGASGDKQQIANWIGNDLVRRLEAQRKDDEAGETDTDPAQSKVSPGALAELVALVVEKKINRKAGEQVLDVLVAEGGHPQAVVEAKGLAAVGGEDELRPVVQAALDANPDVVEKLKTGNMKPIGAIVGAVMKETKGRADGGEVTRITREILGL